MQAQDCSSQSWACSLVCSGSLISLELMISSFCSSLISVIRFPASKTLQNLLEKGSPEMDSPESGRAWSPVQVAEILKTLGLEWWEYGLESFQILLKVEKYMRIILKKKAASSDQVHFILLIIFISL